MRSTKNRRAVIVGIVLALGLALFMLGVFTLGGQKKSFASTITLRAVFSDVNGLQKGNNIWFSGVKVGTIRSVQFDNAARVIVSMNVEESVQRFIHANAKAKVSTDGLIGNRIIVIYGGTLAAPTVSSGDTLGVETQSSAEGLMDTLAQNNRNLLAITANFKKLSEEVMSGKGTAGRILTQDEMANTLQASLNALRAATNNANALSANLAAYSGKLNAPGTLASDLVSDTTIMRGLRRTVRELHGAALNITAVTNKLETGDNAVHVLLSDPQAASDLKAMLRNLNAGTAKLDTNMEALQHNFLLRGFFKKKRRKEEEAARKGSRH